MVFWPEGAGEEEREPAFVRLDVDTHLDPCPLAVRLALRMGHPLPLSLAICHFCDCRTELRTLCVTSHSEGGVPPPSQKATSEKRPPSTSDCSLTPLRSCPKPKTHFNINRKKKIRFSLEGRKQQTQLRFGLFSPAGSQTLSGRVVPGPLYLLPPCAVCLSLGGV